MPSARVLGVELLAEQGGLCALCRLPLQPNGVTLDHIVPLAQGGTGGRANLQAAHQRCNSWKADIENAVGHCWRCKASVSGEVGALKHWAKRHPNGFITVKAWRKAAAVALKQEHARAVRKSLRNDINIRPKKPKGHRPAVPWPAPNYVPRTGPYATSNGISADGMLGSP